MLKLDWCTYEAAKFACQKWHYSKSVPMPPLNCVGVWESEKFIGCVLFGRGASPHLGAKFGLAQTEVCELVRIALTKHQTPVSRIVAIAVKFLKQRNPGLRLIVSFADTNQGHHGGIYQAGNWLYSGKTSDKKHFMDKTGRVWHSRQVSNAGTVKSFGKSTKCVKRSDCSEVLLMGKHRYLMPLDAQMRAQIEPMREPYPKRDIGVE